jgi:hypothetical protein
MRSMTVAHLAVSSETPSVPAKRVEINPIRREGVIPCLLIHQAVFAAARSTMKAFYTIKKTAHDCS